eukprot:6192197-Pleurochrysis_carterae.AAC.3
MAGCQPLTPHPSAGNATDWAPYSSAAARAALKVVRSWRGVPVPYTASGATACTTMLARSEPKEGVARAHSGGHRP